MADIRKDVVWFAYHRVNSLIDYTICDTIDKRLEFRKKTTLADKYLTNDGKSEVIKLLNKDYDHNNIYYNNGTKRICENCQDEFLAILYCEHCVRNYLKSKFSNWTSGNGDIDNLLQQYQMETLISEKIV